MDEDFIFELDFIDNMEDSGMSAISFVKDPATQINLEYFEVAKDQTFTDYPKEDQEGACKVLEWIEKYGSAEVS